MEQAEGYLKEVEEYKGQMRLKEMIDSATKAASRFYDLELWEKCLTARYYAGGFQFITIKDKQKRFDYLKESLEIALKHFGNHHFTSEVYKLLGLEHGRIGDLRGALPYLIQSIDMKILLGKEYSTDAVEVYNHLVMTYKGLKEYEKVKKYVQKSIGISLQLKQDVQNGVIDQSLEKKVLTDLANSYFNMGMVWSALNDCNKALEQFEKALDIQLKVLNNADFKLALTYSEMAKSFGGLYKVEEALLYFNKALRIKKNLFGDEHPNTVEEYSGIAMCYYSKKKYAKAIEYANKTVLVCENSYGLAHYKTMRGFNVLVKSYIDLQEYSKALHIAEKIREGESKAFGDINFSYLKYLVIIHYNKEAYEEALSALSKVEEKLLENNMSRLSGYAWIDYYYGLIYAKQEKYTKAIQALQKTIGILCRDAQSEDIYTNPLLKSENLSEKLLNALLEKADVAYQLYLHKSKDIRDYRLSLSSYKLAMELLHKIQSHLDLDASKLHLSDEMSNNRIYGNAMKVALDPSIEIDSKNNVSFTFSEKAKASVLYSSLQDSLAKSIVNIPSNLLQQEKDLKVRLTYIDKNIQQEEAKGAGKNEEKLQKLQVDFFDLHQEYTQLIQGFEQSYPDYYQLKYQTKTASIETVQETLSDNQWMVSYFVGETHYYIFFIGKDVFEVLEYEKTDDFETLVNDFLQSIQQHQLEMYSEKAYELYQYLLQPVEMYLIDPLADFTSMEEHLETAQMPQLIIIPHGILNYIPFEALICTRTGKRYDASITGQEKTKAYQSLDYLLLHCEVSYHYSATLWHYLLTTRGGRAIVKDEFVGFAPVYENTLVTNERKMEKSEAGNGHKEAWEFPANEMQNWASRSEALRSDGTWTPLPYSKTETQSIAALFEERGLSTQTFLHEQATKEQFQQSVENSRFLLIATHGVVNDEHPKLSGLVFYPNPSQPLSRSATVDKVETREVETLPTVENFGNSWNEESTTDCILSMEETYHLNLSKTDLVVLSSCESGIGELAKGEGMMAVNRGFLYAGAKNVVSTLFKVYDKPSSLLTQYLFEGILEGKGYSESLRLAKLRLLRLEEVDVKSWCGFVLIGG